AVLGLEPLELGLAAPEHADHLIEAVGLAGDHVGEGVDAVLQPRHLQVGAVPLGAEPVDLLLRRVVRWRHDHVFSGRRPPVDPGSGQGSTELSYRSMVERWYRRRRRARRSMPSRIMLSW